MGKSFHLLILILLRCICCFIKLTHTNQVKLTDVGVAKRERDISGTFCGTPLYLAPEVLDGQVCDNKADMYSFGIILWEMWYATTAFHVELVSRSQLQLLNDIREGLRPSHIDGTRQPWGLWNCVMMTCWDKEPKHRLTAKESWEELDNLQRLLKQTHTNDMGNSASPQHSSSETMFHSSPAHELPAAESNAASSPPRPVPKPRITSKTQPAAKPQPAPRRNTPRQASVRFSAATEDGKVHFQLGEKTKQ